MGVSEYRLWHLSVGAADVSEAHGGHHRVDEVPAQFGTVLNPGTTTSQNCEALPRGARI